MRHIREVHPHFEGKVKCIVSNCPSTLSTYESLRHHMYKYHKEALKNDHSSDITSEVCTDILAEADSLEGNSTEIERNDEKLCDQDGPYNYEAAKYILRIQEGKKLTQTVTEGIIRDTTMMIDHTVWCLKEKVYGRLKDIIDTDFTEAHLHELEEIFTSSEICHPFQHLLTRYQQERFFQEHFNYVVSSEYNIQSHTRTHPQPHPHARTHTRLQI